VEYLKSFERWSREPEIEGLKSNIPEIAKAKCGVDRLAACAGIAVVKLHFPFHRAYELAEDLLKSAKMVKRNVKQVPCCALDFHVHFDSSGADVDAFRAKLNAPDACLTAKPYVVTSLGDLRGAPPADLSWARLRCWEGDDGIPGLSDAASALARRGSRSDDGSGLPRSQQHYLREGLFLGREAADGRLRQIVHRYAAFPWEALHPDRSEALHAQRNDPTLFFQDDKSDALRAKANKPPARLTWFLDALELAELRGAQ
jgi:hypothetical protein